MNTPAPGAYLPPQHFEPSAISALDDLLPGGGWPLGTLLPVYANNLTQENLPYLFALFRQMTRQQRWLTCVAPPYLPQEMGLHRLGISPRQLLMVYPRSETNGIDVFEDALKSRRCGAVFAWPSSLEPATVQRLNAAAVAGSSLGVLIFHGEQYYSDSTPCHLHLNIDIAPDSLAITLRSQSGNYRRQLTLQTSRLLPDRDLEQMLTVNTADPNCSSTRPAGPELLYQQLSFF